MSKLEFIISPYSASYKLKLTIYDSYLRQAPNKSQIIVLALRHHSDVVNVTFLHTIDFLNLNRLRLLLLIMYELGDCVSESVPILHVLKVKALIVRLLR